MKKIHAYLLLLGMFVLYFFAVQPVHAEGDAVWIADWDAQKGLDETAAVQASNIVLFAAYFNLESRPFLNDDMRRMLKNNPRKNLPPDGKLFLSVVNDVFYTPEKSLEKDPTLIKNLMSTEKSRAAHRDDLLKLLASGPFDGLEIDYERVGKEDWPTLLDFAADLSKQLTAQGKELRFLLEPKSKYMQIPLPKGPEYVIMGYNLFGGHSGPGPKANDAFLRKLARESSAIVNRTGKKMGLALATGGFAWPAAPDKTKVLGIRESAAAAWARGSQATLIRDPDSHALHFIASDTAPGSPIPARSARDINYEIWYADGETLAHWIKTGRAAGFGNISLWRLGGNTRESLSAFARAAK